MNYVNISSDKIKTKNLANNVLGGVFTGTYKLIFTTHNYDSSDVMHDTQIPGAFSYKLSPEVSHEIRGFINRVVGYYYYICSNKPQPHINFNRLWIEVVKDPDNCFYGILPGERGVYMHFIKVDNKPNDAVEILWDDYDTPPIYQYV